MTCFWSGILHALQPSHYRTLGLPPRTRNVQALVRALTQRARTTPHVRWCGQVLSDKMQRENLTWIRAYKAARIGQGHWCGGCDPFLLLLSELLSCTITHVYAGHTLHYVYTGPNPSGSTLRFASNHSHFWAKR